MSERDYVLAVLGAAEEIPGRTVLQKLVYLLAAVQHDELEYRAHFYGPYSPVVQQEADRLVALGLAEELVVVHPAWTGEEEVREHRYRLTEDGRDALEGISDDLRGAADRLVSIVKGMNAWKQAPLSLAAKLHHIRVIEPHANLEDAPRLARQFGWRIAPADATLGAQVLGELGLGTA